MQTAILPKSDRRLSSEEITTFSTLSVERVRVQTPSGDIVDNIEITDKAPIDGSAATHRLSLTKPEPSDWAAFIETIFAIGYRTGLAETDRLSVN